MSKRISLTLKVIILVWAAMATDMHAEENWPGGEVDATEEKSKNDNDMETTNVLIREIPKTSSIEILGHTFNGINDIRNAAEIFGRIGDTYWEKGLKNLPEGIHVICFYSPYPCFDSEDYAYENRNYSNYFFSTEPFTKEQLDRLFKLPCNFNARMINEEMPEWALPAVYYGGEGDIMIVATLKE